MSTPSPRSGAGGADGIAQPVTADALARLQIWLSPSFPIGAFAYSQGLEKSVELGWIKDRVTLESWLVDLIARGALRNDLIILAASWRAAAGLGDKSLADIAELALAVQSTAERHLETTQQGGSFIIQVETSWPAPAPSWAAATNSAQPVYPAAIGYAAAVHAIPLAETLNAYAIAFVGNLTSAAIRLSVIGQTDAQRVTAQLLDRLLAATTSAATSNLDAIGSATWRADIASMQHESQHTRLFRS